MVFRIKTEEDRIEEDFNWLAQNSLKIHRKYAGKWIAVVDKRIAGIGKTIKEAYKKAKNKYPDQEPLLDAVEKGAEVIYAML